MKHVFVINSHTTFLTSMGTVDLLGLSKDKVIFVYIRNYSNSVSKTPYKICECTSLFNSCSNITEDYKQKVRNVDSFISHEIGERYNLYVPHLMHWFFQLLYTNHKCRRVSYLQEGGPAQSKLYDNDITFIECIKSFIRLAILRHRIFESKWYTKGSIYKQCGLDSYATNDMYFRMLPSRNHIIKWPKVELDMSLNQNAPIFIFDGFITNRYVEPDIYLQCCKEIINRHARDFNYIKFHPAQQKEERDTLLSYFTEKGLNAEIMRDDIPTEYVILQFNGLTFVGFMSSLLYYAHDLGHNVICCEDLILSNSPLYIEHKEITGFITYGETYGFH